MSAPGPSPCQTSGDFTAATYANDNKKHLLLAASGSVATIKILNVCRFLSGHEDLSIRLIFTASASNFFAGHTLEQPKLSSIRSMRNVDGIYLDQDEWTRPWERGAPILHIELRRWADILVIAPLSANSMAKMCMGLADNLLLSVVRAWDTDGRIEGRKKRIVVAPAMNTGMWLHPVTKGQIQVLEEEWGVNAGGWVEVLRPVEKTLACGDVGGGGMTEWMDIVRLIEERLDVHDKKAGE